MRFLNKNYYIRTVNDSLIDYRVYSNITYWWNFGVLAGICLFIQILTGIFLAMHYVAHVDLAFNSIEHIMRDVNYGWLIRYVHANGASFFFLVVYLHICRGIYYLSFVTPREGVWCTGVIIFFLMIITAFMGYVLPWGQMSFWAATVITNLVTAIPFFGDYIVIWLWGGFSVDNATLNRFFSFHYLLPFILLGLVFLHIIFLHSSSSSNPLGIFLTLDKIPFHPYFIVKDVFSIFIFLFLFSYFIFFYPNYLGHPDNYIPANPLVTPTHIVPEWYFLIFYAMLRSIPNKLLGVIILFFAIVILFILPFLTNKKLKGFYKTFYKILFWWFFLVCFFLGLLGGLPAEEPFVTLSRIFTFLYFIYFFIYFFQSFFIPSFNTQEIYSLVLFHFSFYWRKFLLKFL